MAAPLGDSSENSQLLQKLLYESYQGRSTVQVAGSPGIIVNFRKDTPKLKIDTPDRRDPGTDYLPWSLLWLKKKKMKEISSYMLNKKIQNESKKKRIATVLG